MTKHNEIGVALLSTFAIPDDDKWDEAIESAQRIYELAKSNELDQWNRWMDWKLVEDKRWEEAITRVIETAKRETGATVARTPAKELAKIEPEWLKYQDTLWGCDYLKREAESFHSIAYQRLDTLKQLYAKR